jgi:hypothetical protein
MVVTECVCAALSRFVGLLNSLSCSQSQSINPLYLSTVAVGERRKPMDRKTDYVFSYSHRHPEISALYDLLDANNTRDIGPTLDTFTKRTALFSGFEVKPASGDHTDAELRMSIWIAASLRKKQELLQDAQISVDPTLIVEPSFTIVGHDHSVYYACPRDDLVSGRNGIHVVGPDLDRFERLSTNSIRGIFRLLKFYGNLMNYGSDQSDDGDPFWTS